MMEGQTKVFNFQKLIIKTLQKSAPGFFHQCPYEGKQSILNVSSPKDVVEILPVGTFKVIFKAFDIDDKNIFTISVYSNVFKV